ncbi:MAG: hypothetical protein Q9163_000479 [Psora crenata]
MLWNNNDSTYQNLKYHQQLGPIRWLLTWIRAYPGRQLRPEGLQHLDDLAERGENANVFRASEYTEDILQSTVRRRRIKRLEQPERSPTFQFLTQAAIQGFPLGEVEYERSTPQGASLSTQRRRASSLPAYLTVSSSPPTVNTRLHGDSNALCQTIEDFGDAQPSRFNIAAFRGTLNYAAEAANLDAVCLALSPHGPMKGRSGDIDISSASSLITNHNISARLQGCSAPKRDMPDAPSKNELQGVAQANAPDENRNNSQAAAIIPINHEQYRTFSWDKSRRSTLDIPRSLAENKQAERRTLQEYETESTLDYAISSRDGSQTTASTYHDIDNWHRDPSQSFNQNILNIPLCALAMYKFGTHDWLHTTGTLASQHPDPLATAIPDERSGCSTRQPLPRGRFGQRRSLSIPRREEVLIVPREDHPFLQDGSGHSRWTGTNIYRTQRTSPMPARIPFTDGAHDRLDVPRKRAVSPKKEPNVDKEPLRSAENYTLNNLPSSAEFARRGGPFTNPFAPERAYSPAQLLPTAGQHEQCTAGNSHRRGTSLAFFSPAEILRPFSPDTPLVKRSSSVPAGPHTQSSPGITEWQLHRRQQSITREFSAPASAERARRRLRRVGNEGVGALKTKAGEVKAHVNQNG